MASSTSSTHKSFTYDVFLSFQGETRKSFVDHLYFALQLRNIRTYKDDDEIKKGRKISDEHIRSIKDSKFYIIVYSKNYASSSWCLDELVNIMECNKTNGKHVVYPIFFDVEPSEISKLTGTVGKAFEKHGENNSAKKWKGALKEAANVSGWHLWNTCDG
ncbi:disease resistance protein RUN1-like [Helianthus annuus]|uniref:disease resistance protein RUN1-like n=1 Tax=Helianthus annuus TaxID=4232 RepID=UPI000B902BB4|nr:disease resistance protein RUN1-like [Helianthus annuus]